MLSFLQKHTQVQFISLHPSYSNLPLLSPHNYHIELCHTNGNHFDRVISLVPRQLFELPSNPSYEDYIKDLPTLPGIDDKENILLAYYLPLLY